MSAGDPGRAWAAAALIREESTCMRRQVGAVLVGQTHGWRLGHNYETLGRSCRIHCPRGSKTHDELPAYAPFSGDGECIAVHAEQMVLSDMLPDSAYGCSLFVTDEPCKDCWQLIDLFEGLTVWVLITGRKYEVKKGKHEDLR